jgi:thioesterase domain-containing protein
MARHYVGLMRNAVPRGRILLGGWSLGGLLSLEMARVLAGDPDYTVIGMVMMDSICPTAAKTRTGAAKAAVVPYKHQFGPNTKQETIEGIERCFTEARKSVAAWTLPRWDTNGSIAKGDDDLGYSTQNGEDSGEAGDGQLQPQTTSSSIKCPPTILLRAREAVPTEPGEVSFVDATRHSRSLGWDEYQRDFFVDIVDISGHHFSIFAWEYIDDVSQKLMDACDALEKTAAGALT